MLTYLRLLVSLLPGPLRAIATPLVDRLVAIWQWSESLARRVRDGWRRLQAGARRMRDGLDKLGRETFVTLRWLLSVRVPALLRTLRDDLVQWVTGRLRDLLLAVDQARRLVLDLGARIRNELLSRVDGLRRWLLEAIKDLVATVAALRDRALHLWGTPERLATWLAGAMWSALWRYAWSQMDRLTSALWRQRRVITLQILAEVERQIGRLL